jgi:hypothetical protein
MLSNISFDLKEFALQKFLRVSTWCELIMHGEVVQDFYSFLFLRIFFRHVGFY